MTGHSHVRPTQRGFTMVELIVVLVLIGILGAIGAVRFFERSGFDADAFTEQTRAALRYAQKVAVARNGNVSVRLDGGGIALCHGAAGCNGANKLVAPGGAYAGDSNACGAGGGYCIDVPTNIAYTVDSTATYFYYDALGQPRLPNGALLGGTGLALTISGDGQSRTVRVEPDTGYVH